ncbi:MAG: M28 family peptidase [Myxococcales bacterium]|nr:M28 family peptidase [Myxococcales bacterium]
MVSENSRDLGLLPPLLAVCDMLGDVGLRRIIGHILLVLACSCKGGSRGGTTPVIEDRSGPLSAESLMADVEFFCSEMFKGRGSYQAGSKLASNHISEEFERLGYKVLRQPIRGRHAENIIAIKRGGDQAVVVSAHHDHLGVRSGQLYPGADDNASGLAVLLGIARSRAARSYGHTVIFISFGAEEDGLVGSGVYVHDPLWPLAKTRAVINFDMVGRNFFEAGADQAEAAAVVGLEFDETLGPVAEKAASEVGLHLIRVPARLLELFTLHDRTDDWWFRRQGIGAIHFSTGLHNDYHQGTDTTEKIRPGQLARVAHTAAALLDALANSRRKGDPFKH